MEIDMDIKELEAFVYVVENSSFSRAAELLHLTQPTISSHISALERKLDTKLIVRTTKETYPSDAGKLLYRYAKQILQLREDAAVALHNYSREMRGTIALAASSLPSRYFLPSLLQRFRERYPDILFSIQMEDSPRVAELIAGREVELGFCGTQSAQNKCAFRQIAGESMVLITPDSEPYRAFAPDAFPTEQILRQPMIVREKTSGTYRYGRELLRRLGVDVSLLHTAVEVRSTSSLVQMVADGMGIGVVTRCEAEHEAAQGRILMFSFPTAPVQRGIYIVRHKNSILSPIAQTFYDFSCQYYASVT
ncbi:MAG: LysR family transcriptional regulator [Oscillospiraceae bacterium]|nr:LysR family transcriptional regulator [Oscillospiraceae bacterium]